MKHSDDTVSKMTSAPVGPLIISLAIPTVISMVVTNIYNSADTYFVSKLGDSASGAVGIIFSIMAGIQAIGFTIGMGSGSIVSRLIGSRQNDRANIYSSSGLAFSFSLGLVFAILGITFQDQIITSLGATDTILPYARDYAKYIFIGTPFIATSFVMNNQLRFQGKAILGMTGLATGGIINIFLDPLFIFGLNMGISGAAIATLCSQCISFSILISMFIRRKTITTLSPSFIAKNFHVYKEIFTTGLPSLFRQGLGSLSVIFLNTQARYYGALDENILKLVWDPELTVSEIQNAASDATIAAMAITNRFFMLLMSVAIGLGQGYQPVCGMNYGAQKYDRVRDALKFLIKIVSIIMTVFSVTVLIFAPQIASFFRDSEAVIYVAKTAMRVQAIALPFHSIIFGTNMTLQTTGHKKTASLTSSFKQGLFFLPLLFILPYFFGVPGIQFTQGIADILSVVFTVPFLIHFLRKIK